MSRDAGHEGLVRGSRPARRRIWLVFVVVVAGLAIVSTRQGDGARAYRVCAPETHDRCKPDTRSVKSGTFGRVIVPIDLSRCVARAATCAELRAHPAVEFLSLSHPREPSRLIVVVRFASAGEQRVTAELPEGPYAIYLFVPPHDAVGNARQVGVRIVVRRGQTTTAEPLTPRAGAVFSAFGGA